MPKISIISLFPFHCDSLIVRVHTVTIEFSIFSHSGKKTYFKCFFFSLRITLCNGASIRKYEAYSFSLINRCGQPKKSNNCGHSLLWSDTCEFSKYNFYQKKVNKQVKGFLININHSNKKQTNKSSDIYLQILQWTMY